MSANINNTLLKNFILSTIGRQTLTTNEADKYGIETDIYGEADVNDDTVLDIGEMLENDDIRAAFTKLYNEELDQDKKNAANKEEEKRKVTAKNGGNGV